MVPHNEQKVNLIRLFFIYFNKSKEPYSLPSPKKTSVIASPEGAWQSPKLVGNVRGSPRQCEHWLAMTRVILLPTNTHLGDRLHRRGDLCVARPKTFSFSEFPKEIIAMRCDFVPKSLGEHSSPLQ